MAKPIPWKSGGWLVYGLMTLQAFRISKKMKPLITWQAFLSIENPMIEIFFFKSPSLPGVATWGTIISLTALVPKVFYVAASGDCCFQRSIFGGSVAGLPRLELPMQVYPRSILRYQHKFKWILAWRSDDWSCQCSNSIKKMILIYWNWFFDCHYLCKVDHCWVLCVHSLGGDCQEDSSAAWIGWQEGLTLLLPRRLEAFKLFDCGCVLP